MDIESTRRMQKDFNLDHNVRVLAETKEEKDVLWKFVFESSNTLRNELGKHGAGHDDININSASGAFMLLGLILIACSTLYMLFRVYHKQKFLTEAWLKDHDYPGKPNGVPEPVEPKSEGKKNKT